MIPLIGQIFDSGTLVHYCDGDASLPEVIPLPASATGRMARISLETLRLAAQVRSKGTKLVLVSGTRYSTFAKRLPYLPRADAYVIENGGRVFYPEEKEKDVGDEKDGAGQDEHEGDNGHDTTKVGGRNVFSTLALQSSRSPQRWRTFAAHGVAFRACTTCTCWSYTHLVTFIFKSAYTACPLLQHTWM